MTTIPTIKLTKYEYKNLLKSAIVNYGGESLICRSNRPDTLYKIFTYNKEKDEDIFHNKQMKIQILYDIPTLAYSITPISNIEVDGTFSGYEITYDNEDIALADVIIPHEDTIYYLNKVEHILNYYKSLGIIYGDVRSDNILINKNQKKVKFCDLDNIQIKGYPIDIMTKTLEQYIEERGTTDHTVDSYMFNLLTLEQLIYPNDNYENILKRIRSGIFPHNFDNPAYRVLESMLRPKDYNGETILQYIKK